VDPQLPGSRLDADYPENGVLIPCRITVDGYNAYVAQLPRTSLVSLTLFDSEGIDLIRDGVRPGAAKLKTGDYQPRGMTPLYDAIGHTIAEAERRSVGFERVALVILTDGYENASTDFKRKDILKLLKQKQERDGWLVIYLGANQDAWAVGQQFGAAVGNPPVKAPGLHLHDVGRNTPLRIPYGNKEVAQKLGARYGADGWYAPPGVDLSAFKDNGWL
jgi:hypothetical protein